MRFSRNSMGTAPRLSPELDWIDKLTTTYRYDAARGTKVVGHRGYFLKKWGVFLNQAIINYGLEFLDNKDYIPLQTPQLMLKDQMAKTAQLSQFDEELYKVTGDENDKYLIAVCFVLV